ncbi:unnamed protein product [Calicophoron daubneyi]
MKIHDAGGLRYKVSPPKEFVVTSCALKTLILSNPDRFKLRREPVPVFSLDEPFGSFGGFSFNEVKPEEVLIEISTPASTKIPSILLANISPFTLYHSILVPQPSSCWNQRLRRQALLSAIECQLLSNDAYLCMGFNSLMAHASVNHLHFHIWQSPEYLHAMSSAIQPRTATPSFFEIPEHPVHNFVLELHSAEEIDQFVDKIWSVVLACQNADIAHNLFLARSRSSGLLRAVLWPRRAVDTPKSTGPNMTGPGYNVAVAELAGMFVVASDEVALQLRSEGPSEVLKAERLSDEDIKRVESKLQHEFPNPS